MQATAGDAALVGQGNSQDEEEAFVDADAVAGTVAVPDDVDKQALAKKSSDDRAAYMRFMRRMQNPKTLRKSLAEKYSDPAQRRAVPSQSKEHNISTQQSKQQATQNKTTYNLATCSNLYSENMFLGGTPGRCQLIYIFFM